MLFRNPIALFIFYIYTLRSHFLFKISFIVPQNTKDRIPLHWFPRLANRKARPATGCLPATGEGAAGGVRVVDLRRSVSATYRPVCRTGRANTAV